MARRRTHAPLNVFLNSRSVGVLRRKANGAIDFQYATEWRDWEHTFPVSLSLPLREDRYIGVPVINVFDNLLPDGDVIRRRVAERVGAGGTRTRSASLPPLARTASVRYNFFPTASTPARLVPSMANRSPTTTSPPS